MIRILFDQIAGIVDNTFKEMKEIQEILIAGDALHFFRLLLPLMIRLSSVLFSCLVLLLEKLSSNVLECLDISSDSPDRLIHLYDVLKHVVFLSLLHKHHDSLAIQYEVLLSLFLQLLHLLQVTQLQTHQLHLLEKILELVLLNIDCH